RMAWTTSLPNCAGDKRGSCPRALWSCQVGHRNPCAASSCATRMDMPCSSSRHPSLSQKNDALLKGFVPIPDLPTRNNTTTEQHDIQHEKDSAHIGHGWALAGGSGPR